MTLSELIERLQELADAGHGDTEVMVVHQPHYPLQETIGGVWTPEDEPKGRCGECGRPLSDGECPECGWTPDDSKEQEHFVYIVANGHHHTASPYGPRRAFDDAC